MAGATQYWMYVGNYGKGEPGGIYLYRYDGERGALTGAGLGAVAKEPNFVVVHPNGRYLYALTSTKVADYSGAVEAFEIDAATGKLRFLNRQPSGGDNPAHLAVNPTGKLVIVANYSGGTIAAFPLKASGEIDGASEIVHHKGSSINPRRQTKPYPHGITFDATGKVILVPDLGMDRILRYRVDIQNGALAPDGEAVSPPGSGPRHVAFSKDQRFFYVINELTTTLSVYSYGGADALREIETIAPWPRGDKFSGAEIEVHPNGKFLYASNRGHDSIAICELDSATGKLKVLGLEPCGGKTPRHFGLDPTAGFMLVSNQDSDSIVVFRVDGGSGRLSPAGVAVEAGAPCCVAFVRIP